MGEYGYTDDFNRTDVSPPSASAEGWTWEVSGTATDASILTNQLNFVTSLAYKLLAVVIDFPTADHFADALCIPQNSVNSRAGVAVRVNVGTDTAYIFYTERGVTGTNDSPSYLRKRVAGVETLLATGPTGLSSTGTRLRLEAKGTTLTAYVNGAQVLQVTDSSLSTGRAGVHGYPHNGASRAKIDDFLCGPLTTRVRKPAGKTRKEVFAASGTWVKPDGAKWVKVVCVGGGAGGGSGRRSVSTGGGAGGAGGGAGGLSSHVFRASDLSATVAMTVGAGAAGGAANGGTSANGTAGGTGGTSSFGAYLRAIGGVAGAGGGIASTGVTAAPTSGATDLPLIAGGCVAATGGAAPAATLVTRAPASGGGGGGVTTGNVVSAAGAGGAQSLLGVSGGLGGAAETAGSVGQVGLVGTGGGGGGASVTASVTAGAGGAGGLPGGGGGGGGAALNTAGNGGAGGAGANGQVTVWVEF